MSAREYFPGCHDVALDLSLEPVRQPIAPTSDSPTLADAVLAAERRRRVDGDQLTLPAELMPVPSDRLFA